MSAVFSDCGTYRYALWRNLGAGDLLSERSGTCLFVMLNPSTADAELDDATIRRCIGFAQRWGYASLAVGNVYGFRATDPRAMKATPQPVGENGLDTGWGSRFTYDNMNDEWLRKLALKADCVIAAWGTHAEPRRATEVSDLLAAHFGPFDCLGLTKQGHPKHPLYLRSNSERIHFDPYPDRSKLPVSDSEQAARENLQIPKRRALPKNREAE